MNGFLMALSIAALAAVLTYLGAPVAERFAVPSHIIYISGLSLYGFMALTIK